MNNMPEQTITLHILTEDHSPERNQRKVTGYTIDPIIAEAMLQDSFFGEMEQVQITQEQWDAIQRIVKSREAPDA